MTIKDKLKSYNFWITLVSAVILLLQVFGEKFNFKVDSTFIIDVTTALCSIFVVLGIISVPKQKTTKTEIQIVQPNYDELSEQISSQLSTKLEELKQIKTQVEESLKQSQTEENTNQPEENLSENNTASETNTQINNESTISEEEGVQESQLSIDTVLIESQSTLENN